MLPDLIIKELSHCSDIYNNTLAFCGGVTYHNNILAEYAVNIKNNIITIVFKGTDTKSEWLSNLMFCKKQIPYGNVNPKIRVHSGFIDTYKNKNVREKIHSLIPQKPCKIFITGHSRGAALAILCAVDLQYNFPDKDIEVYLFGSPRVGNSAFCKSYNKRVFKTLRIENGNDIITKIPPALLGFRHVGTRVGVGTTRLPLLFSAKAHFPHRYLKGIIDRMFT